MCLRKSQKRENYSFIDLRDMTLNSIRPQQLIWRQRMVLLLKKLYQQLQKLPVITRDYTESTDQNHVIDRLILTAGLVVFFVTLIYFYFK